MPRLRMISPCTTGIGLIWRIAKGLKRKLESSVEVLQTVQLFQDYLGGHFGFSVESLSEFDIYSLCACDVFSDCPKWTFLNWPLVFIHSAILLRNIIKKLQVFLIWPSMPPLSFPTFLMIYT